MLRAVLCALLLLTACRKEIDPTPSHPQQGADAPPLPPASGTPIGYLVDSASQLGLRDDQLTQLKQIDDSLAALDAGIDAQLRGIEKPEEDPEVPKGAPPPRHNNAPGAQVKTTPDAQKLHSARKSNDFEALQKAFALLDPGQQAAARKLLEDRGIAAPGSDVKPPKHDSDDGTPLP
jgi:hypothetical protein